LLRVGEGGEIQRVSEERGEGDAVKSHATDATPRPTRQQTTLAGGSGNNGPLLDRLLL
jgi:hypothetical protein